MMLISCGSSSKLVRHVAAADRFGAFDHGSELDDREDLAMSADAVLSEKHRTPARAENEDRDHGHEWGRDHEDQDGQNSVEHIAPVEV
jgi:hypothetical protein